MTSFVSTVDFCFATRIQAQLVPSFSQRPSPLPSCRKTLDCVFCHVWVSSANSRFIRRKALRSVERFSRVVGSMFSPLCETSDSEENSAKLLPDSKVDSEKLPALLEYSSKPIETRCCRCCSRSSCSSSSSLESDTTTEFDTWIISLLFFFVFFPFELASLCSVCCFFASSFSKTSSNADLNFTFRPNCRIWRTRGNTLSSFG